MANPSFSIGMWEWLIASAQMVNFYYGTIPVKELYKVFQSGKYPCSGYDEIPDVRDLSEKDYTEMLRQILSIGNDPQFAGTPGLMAAGITCRLEGNEAVASAPDELIRKLRTEKRKHPIEYRILSHEEVIQVVTKGYIDTPQTAAMENHLKIRWKKSDKEASDIVRHISIGFRTGEDEIQDALNELSRTLGTNREESALTPEEFKEMADLLIQVHNTTGRMDRCGWSPVELYEKAHGMKPPAVECKIQDEPEPSPLAAFDNLKPGSTISPRSSVMAAILKEHEAELTARGLSVDFERNVSWYRPQHATAAGISGGANAKKVYPNDPCPCGSGRQYRNCHGQR